MKVLLTVFLVFTLSSGLFKDRMCFSEEKQSLHPFECVDWHSEDSWTEGRFPYEGQSTGIPYKKKIDRFIFSGNLKAHVSNSYPRFQSNSDFIQRVNQRLCQNAKDALCKFLLNFVGEVKEDNELNQDSLDMGFDEREFRYLLTPTHASAQLVCIFGELNYFAGLPHGSSRYYGFNYWKDGQQIQELTLESLFSPEKDFANFLIDYCLSTLKYNQVGYFHPDPDGNIPVKIELKDLNAFTLSKNGLTITFQPYHVGGWADGPYSVTIPFQKLMHLIRPEGPLSVFIENPIKGALSVCD